MSHVQSALDAAGTLPGELAMLWWSLLATTLAVLAGVVMTLLRGRVQSRAA